MESVGKVAERKVEFTLSAGSSRLTLMVVDINARVTSGTAILSGAWNGAVVDWTGPADLTSNPLVSRPIAGWPAGAFATELREAAFFDPLGNALAETVVAPPPATTGSGGIIESAGNVLGHAGAWCAGGAVAGATTGAFGGPPGSLGGALAGCAGGTVGALLSDLSDWLQDTGPTAEPPPPPDPPIDPEPIDLGPETQTQPDDPPPPPDGGDGSGSQSATGSDDTGGVGDGGDGGAGGAGGEGDGGDGGGSGGGGGGGGVSDDKPPLNQN